MNTVGAPKTILAMTAEKKPSKEYYLEMVSNSNRKSPMQWSFTAAWEKLMDYFEENPIVVAMIFEKS